MLKAKNEQFHAFQAWSWEQFHLGYRWVDSLLLESHRAKLRHCSRGRSSSADAESQEYDRNGFILASICESWTHAQAHSYIAAASFVKCFYSVYFFPSWQVTVTSLNSQPCAPSVNLLMNTDSYHWLLFVCRRLSNHISFDFRCWFSISLFLTL